MGYLGKVSKRAEVDQDNPVLAGGWTIRFDQSILPRVECEVYHIAVRGPAGSSFQLWLDTTFYDNVANGDINSWDPSQPMRVTPGTNVLFYYDVATGSAPLATLFFREVSPF